MARGVRAAGFSLDEKCRRCGADEWRDRADESRYCVPCDRSAAQTRKKSKRKADPAKMLWHLAKQRATRAGQPFNLTIDDVRAAWPSDGRCPVLGLVLEAGTRSRKNTSPSIDRLNNDWPYEAGNIAIISWRANHTKNDASAAEHEQVAAWMRSRGLS